MLSSGLPTNTIIYIDVLDWELELVLQLIMDSMETVEVVIKI